MGQFSTVNPFSQKTLQTYDFASFEQSRNLIESLTQTQKKWARLSFEQRAYHLQNIASQIEGKKKQWAEMATLEMGKPITQSLAEVEKCILALKEISQMACVELKTEIQKLSHGNFHVVASHHQVVFSIQPWNFPYWQVLRMAACAWMTGHTILLKHSDLVAGCAQLIEKVCDWENEKLLSLVHLKPEDIHRLILNSPEVGLVTFTGSTSVGEKIAETCGKALKKTILELGGNDAYIVMPDADLQKAANDCVTSRLINSGQSCVSAKRFYLHHSIKAPFLGIFEDLLKSKKVGDPMNPQTQVGPLASPAFFKKLEAQIQLAQSMGVPLKVVNVNLGYLDFGTQLRAFEAEEIFAPVACFYEFSDLDMVIEAINCGPYGLAGGIFTKNTSDIEKAARELQVGTFTVNSFSQSHPLLPFGGTKKSGISREMGTAGLHDFVSWKVVGGPGF